MDWNSFFAGAEAMLMFSFVVALLLVKLLPDPEPVSNGSDAGAADRAALVAALQVLLATDAVAPQFCFNTSHQGILSQDDCLDCRQERKALDRLERARSAARAVLSGQDGDE